MASRRSTRPARIAGMAVGAALAIALIAGGRPAAGGDAIGAEVGFYANPTGELAISPAGPEFFMRDRALMPGETLHGQFDLTNQAGVPLELQLTAVGSDSVLDSELHIEMSGQDRILAAGRLGDLTEPEGAPLLIGPGDSATVDVEASLPEDAPAAAALVDVAIGFGPSKNQVASE